VEGLLKPAAAFGAAFVVLLDVPGSPALELSFVSIG
jgi:hypothetical protein